MNAAEQVGAILAETLNVLGRVADTVLLAEWLAESGDAAVRDSVLKHVQEARDALLAAEDSEPVERQRAALGEILTWFREEQDGGWDALRGLASQCLRAFIPQYPST